MAGRFISLFSLMRMDDRLFRLHPVRVGDRWYLESDDPDVSRAIHEWGEMHERLDGGEVTQVWYDAWCDSYTPSRRLTDRLGRGFSRTNLYNMRQFYLDHEIFQSVTG